LALSRVEGTGRVWMPDQGPALFFRVDCSGTKATSACDLGLRPGLTFLILGETEVVFGCPSADGFVFNEFGGDHFDGTPNCFVAEQVLGFIEHLMNELLGLAGIAGASHREFFDATKILACALHIVAAGLPTLGGHTGEKDENFSLELILNLLRSAFLDGASSKPVLRWDDADFFNGPPHEQGHHGMAGFVVCSQYSISLHCRSEVSRLPLCWQGCLIPEVV